jgi:hypothetical protein
MQKLENDWLTSGLIDFEYKKYLLLAYDRDHTSFYKSKKLYPHFEDVIEKLKIVNEFLSKINYLEESKKEIDFFDIVNKRIIYHSLIKDESMDEVKAIARYSKEILVDIYSKYRKLLDEVDSNVIISGCKVEIFNSYDGYIILKYQNKEKILRYEIYRLIYPYPHFVVKTGKVDLKEYYSDRYMKNVFDVSFKEMFPLKESMIPVFRKKFLEKVMGFM